MSLDVSQLPADLQEYIQAQIAAALKAQEPAPPKELTPEEKVQAALDSVARSLVAEKKLPSGSDAIHYAVYGALVALNDLYSASHSNAENNG